jgi:capsular exopolysaccharide synthesis family protein
MLDHTSSPPNLDQRPSGRFSAEGEFVGYADIVSFVRRHFWTIAGTLVVALVGALVYVCMTDPIFTARSQILIDPKMPQLLREQSGEVNFSLDNAQVESQIAVLRSEKIAMMVINELNLNKDPEFQEQKASIFGMLPLWPAGGNDTGTTEFARSRRTITTFEGRLDVRRTGLSYAIEIAFSSKDPDKAARVANTTAEAYIRDQIETKSDAAKLGSEWLEQRLAQLRTQLNNATQLAQEFRAKHDYGVRTRGEKSAEPGRQTTDGLLALPRENYTLEELEATAETYRKIYESYLQGFTTSVQRQSFPVPDARIITPATRPLAKSHPRTFLALALGGLAGVMIGFGIAIIRHSLDRSVRFSRQIRDELGLECLGKLPRMVGASDHLDEVAKAPFSRFSGSLKSVKTVVGLMNKTHSIRCLGITSVLPKEGKSTVVSNLATLFSTSGMRTLVVDADIFSPKLTETFAPDARAGLIDAVKNREQAEHYIVPASTAPFDLLPATGKIANSTDVLGFEHMQVLLKDLLLAYDIIIFDVPPANPIVDGLALSHVLDAVVVIAEWGRTPLDLLSEMVRSLRMAKISILGVIMTKVDDAAASGYDKRMAHYYPRQIKDARWGWPRGLRMAVTLLRHLQ